MKKCIIYRTRVACARDQSTTTSELRRRDKKLGTSLPSSSSFIRDHFYNNAPQGERDGQLKMETGGKATFMAIFWSIKFALGSCISGVGFTAP